MIPPDGSFVRVTTHNLGGTGAEGETTFMWSVDLCHYTPVEVGAVGLVLCQDPPAYEVDTTGRRSWMRVLIGGQVMLALAEDLEVVVPGSP